MRVRKATLDDARYVWAIEQEAFDDHLKLSTRSILRFIKLGKMLVVEQEAGLFDDALPPDGIFSLPRGVLGYAVVTDRAGRGAVRIYSIATSRRWRGIGAGSKLLSHVVQAAGDRPVHLEVRYDNIPAIVMYKSRGFVRTAYLKDYYRKGEHALRMELDRNRRRR